jgi:hypothetical protein
MGGFGGMMGGFGGGMMGMGGPMGGGPIVPRSDYRATWLPVEPVPGQAAHLGVVQQALSLSSPIWTEGRNVLAFSTNVRNEMFQTDAILPDTHRPFPSQLWNVNFGLNYLHPFDNGWTLAGGVSLGSASDRPFQDVNSLNAGLNSMLRVPRGEHDAWVFSLVYSPLGQLPFPIPGVSYQWVPSPQFMANLGVPFMLLYRPTDEWSFDASYMLLTNVRANARYRLSPAVTLYGGFQWTNESYFLSGEQFQVSPPSSSSSGLFQQSTDRFYYYEKRLTAGVRWLLGTHALLDLSAGFAFDRYYFEGKSISDSHFNRVDVGDGPFVSGNFLYRW